MSEPSSRMPLPPVLLLLTWLVMVVLHLLVPGPRWVTGAWRWLGALSISLGVVIAFTARRQFIAAGTAVRPFEPSTTLVTSGGFGFTRNPMYLGLMLGATGGAILLGSVTPLLVLPVFAWLLTTQYIQREERLLEAQFGDAYRRYKAKVRRWL